MPHDALSQFLASGGRRASLSPERLELMGKEAAQLYLSKKIPLTEGVTKIAGEVPDINLEQVRRICEFANTSVHLSQHDFDKSAGAEASYPQFDLADPARVFQSLSSQGRSAALAETDVAYSRAPARIKLSNDQREAALAELFGATREKLSHVSVEMAAHDLISTKEDLTSLRDHLREACERLDLMRKEASEEYYDAVKRHLLSGESFADVANAAMKSGLSDEESVEFLVPTVERLLSEKVASVEELSGQNSLAELAKVAHRVINEEHPFVKNLRALLFYDSEIEKVATALDGIDAGLKKVASAIRESFHAPRAS